MKLPQALPRGLLLIGLGLGPMLAFAGVPEKAPNAGAPYSAKGADTCLSCHDDPEVVDVFHTAHAQPNDARTPFGKGGLQCEACHGPGAQHSAKGSKKKLSINSFKADSYLSVEVRNDKLCVFMPPLEDAEDYAAMVAAIEEAARGARTRHGRSLSGARR